MSAAASVERAQLLERIRKLLDRAKRDAGAEAQSARNLAHAMMRQHGITRAELKLDPPRPPKVKLEQKPGPPPARIPVRLKIGGLEIRLKL